MSSDSVLRATLERAGAVFHASTGNASRADEEIRELLPDVHRRLVAGTSGISVYHGAFRLFGESSSAESTGLGDWNEVENWRFAWADRLDGFVLFGESAWGDQYAYRQEGDELEPDVYFLEAISLEAEPIAATFDQFVAEEFLPNAWEPYDVMTVAAVNRLGPIRFDQHWTYAPSLALGGAEDLANVVVLPAATAMRIAGDIAVGLRDDRNPSSLVPWVDARGRQRLRLEHDDERERLPDASPRVAPDDQAAG